MGVFRDGLKVRSVQKYRANHITNEETLNTTTRKTGSVQGKMRLTKLLQATQRTYATKCKQGRDPLFHKNDIIWRSKQACLFQGGKHSDRHKKGRVGQECLYKCFKVN